MRRALQSFVVRLLTSAAWEKLYRGRIELRRRLTGQPHRILYFHQVDDPHSALAAAKLGAFIEAYDVILEPRLVAGPDRAAMTDPEQVARWALDDAAHIAGAYGIPAFEKKDRPTKADVAAAQQKLAACQTAEEFAAAAARIALAFYGQDWLPASEPTDSTSLKKFMADNAAERMRLGHYLSAMFYYGSEWYWGLDRLTYLEERLTALGLRRPGIGTPVAARPKVQEPKVLPDGKNRVPLEVFFSFRSPYSYLALVQLRDMAKRWPLDVTLRPVMPMIRRGVPLTPAKRRYILMDVAREARRLGIPFGHMADPLGRPVERMMAVFSDALAAGCELDFSVAAMRAVWAEGKNMGRDRNLRAITDDFGLGWETCLQAMADESWRENVDENAHALSALGLWGVPAFRVGSETAWGRDRLWLVERWIAQRSGC